MEYYINYGKKHIQIGINSIKLKLSAMTHIYVNSFYFFSFYYIYLEYSVFSRTYIWSNMNHL